MDSNKSITSLLLENRVFNPSEEFSKRSIISDKTQYEDLYEYSIENPEDFWEDAANSNLFFYRKWDKIYSCENHRAQWFEGALTNVSYNCLDRHLLGSNKDKKAIIWEGENETVRHFTYEETHKQVCKVANMLLNLGVQIGDRVAIYMPHVPEAIFTMLACTRIGATHTVIFGGFSAHALKDRINDSSSKILVTADGGFRKGSTVPMKKIADEACQETPSIENIIVLNHANLNVEMKEGRDFYWDMLMNAASHFHEATPLPSEHPLFIMYTSGSTGKPKGLLHTTTGYLLCAHLTAKYIFDFKEKDIFWCTADVGWITGHTYLAYGPLSNGATVFMYEGSPLFPHPGRFWEMIEKHKISIFYTAPTAIRTFLKLGKDWPEKFDLSSLRLIGSVGEPINPEAWIWYYETIGKSRCPIIDTWWQTETGCALISPLPGAIATKPGSATVPFFGIEPIIIDKNGEEISNTTGGYLCIKKPWPSIARTIFNDHERYIKTYWNEIKGVYFTGDGAYKDHDGYYWIMGRIDDVVNVSGHRLGTMEIESVIVGHSAVAECAVIGKNDDIKGQSVFAFITLKSGIFPSDDIKNSIKKHVRSEIGALAEPSDIRFIETLPKTRSGKIMRRLLRELTTTGTINGDITTLEDISILENLRIAEE